MAAVVVDDDDVETETDRSLLLAAVEDEGLGDELLLPVVSMVVQRHVAAAMWNRLN
jgi:hypothetical protein